MSYCYDWKKRSRETKNRTHYLKTSAVPTEAKVQAPSSPTSQQLYRTAQEFWVNTEMTLHPSVLSVPPASSFIKRDFCRALPRWRHLWCREGTSAVRMGPNWGCGLAAAQLWAVLWATSQVAPSPAQLLLFPAGTPGPNRWPCQHGTTDGPHYQRPAAPTLPEPCWMALGERTQQHTALLPTHKTRNYSFVSRGRATKVLDSTSLLPAAQELLPCLWGQRLHAVPEQPSKGRGPVRAAFLPGSFLFLIPLTATKTCTLSSTSGFQQSLPDIKQGDFSPHKTTTKTPSNRVLPY